MKAICLAFIALAALYSCFLGGIQSAVASSSECVSDRLLFDPKNPAANDLVRVTYQPAQNLKGENALNLRARMRGEHFPSYAHRLGATTVAELRATSSGLYAGSFRFPEHFVYATFAVENGRASEVDTNCGAFWPVLAHDPKSGRPLFSALEQRRRDFMGENGQMVLEAATQLTTHYPAHPLSWYLLLFSENFVLGPASQSERNEEHSQRFGEFHEELSQSTEIDPQIAYGMVWYAQTLERYELASFWVERLRQMDPSHHYIVSRKIRGLYESELTSASEALRELEVLWGSSDDREVAFSIANNGFTFSRRTDNGDAVVRWATRLNKFPIFTDRVDIATKLTRHPATVATGIEWLESLLDKSRELKASERPLGVNRDVFARNERRRTRNIQYALGKAYLDNGNVDRALANLEQAAQDGWDSTRFQALATAYISKGDKESAARAYISAMVDPLPSSHVTPPNWLLKRGSQLEEMIEDARSEMVERTLGESIRRQLSEDIDLLDQAEASVTLREVLGPRATVVVFWSRHCQISSQATPHIDELSSELRKLDVPLLVVTSDSRLGTINFLRERNVNLEVLFDWSHEAKRAFNTWGTPQYFVLDGHGSIRFEFSHFDAVMRQALALLNSQDKALPAH